ncbi:MAG: NUDIX hydrolase [Clostridia bacterium]|nr:NUDIX hydrolase [Clostridia bacterium]
METRETPITQEYKFKGKIINLRVDMARLPNGKQATREVVEHPGGVTVAAITKENELVFVRQFRYPYQIEVLEIPAGKLEKGENPFSAGVRELKEETGASAQRYFDLGKFYPTPGYCGEIIYLYAATGLDFSEQNLDEDEFVNVEKIPFATAVEKVVSGEICDGKTQATVLKLDAILRANRLDEFEIKNWRENI